MAPSPHLGRPSTVDVDQILDAACALMTSSGIGPVTLVAVADRAGVSRRTVYRYFSDRAALIDAVIERERDRFVDVALAAAQGEDDLHRALERLMGAVLERANGHELFARLRQTNPEVLYPLLVSTSGLVVDVIVPIAAAFLAAYAPDVAPEIPAAAIEMFSRIVVSYVADPPAGDARDVTSTFAALLTALLTGNVRLSVTAR